MKMREADLRSERRQVFQLQNQITELETHVLESDFEIESRTSLRKSTAELLLEKAQLQSEISREKQARGDERLKEQELLCKSLEEKIWKSEVENIETLDFYDRQERDMQV
ncbi:hypothetical protein Dsin_003939 [Dipteronia sinensis]|uniref:Uncharacterized protein n=1 Tax=Dipteronia sinensis TaxID=43782 RepID=A0AAE0EKQ3_9ROSI|nr:hypothetical protein Dsin_003939 [Dipteronia sinensis]